MATVAQMRTVIPDKPQFDQAAFTGDGSTVRFELPNSPVRSAPSVLSVTVGGAAQVEGIDYTLNRDLGLLTFTAAPGAGVAVAVAYEHTLLSDGDLQLFLGLEPDLRYAAAQAVDAIAANQALVLKVIRLLDLTTDGAKTAEALRERANSLRHASYREVTV